ncbi:ABC transporter permease subunit [Sphingobacterium sp. DK4209]|uniref:ABC transporter permease subunit n=1 Tax=Sphingobacterium zhuxiongii TaxID=2662364 RepID=A0A5Q0QEA0_9SPHI|nr:MULTISPECIES: ABC transporter permease subunit [unclassified Sphingobacterium]MVZ66482.1 ABC transporter permease subunit [Sphingobacterium sp. DK4209]QGA27863.1 ABC transporter permease subunit [Sphingobacterium sp. dk4302]
MANILPLKKTNQKAAAFKHAPFAKVGDFWHAPVTGRDTNSAFITLVSKEMRAAVRSWKFTILILLVTLIFIASSYVSMLALSNLRDAVTSEKFHLYLKLFTTSEQSIPPFYVFLNFLAPLLGISLGFDSINSERNNGTLMPLLSQALFRDDVLLSKFIGPLNVVAILFLSITLMMLGTVMLITGVPLSPMEFTRIILFVLITILYVGFWLSFAVFCSIVFNQPSTSALAAIGLWLFFTVFYPMLVNLLMTMLVANPGNLQESEYLQYADIAINLSRISPSQLYNDATATLLIPSVRTLGPMSLEQTFGAIPSDLTVSNSLTIIFPQLSGLLASSVTIFALCYFLFMRKEIRA